MAYQSRRSFVTGGLAGLALAMAGCKKPTHQSIPKKGSKYAALLIDMQPEFVGSVMDLDKEDAQKTILNQTDILRYFASKNLPVVGLEYKPKEGEEHEETIPNLKIELDSVPRHEYIIKPYNNGFYGTNLNQVLSNWGIDVLLLMGVNSSACVIKTASGALKHNLTIMASTNLMANGWLIPNPRKEDINWYKENGIYRDNHQELIKIIEATR